DPSLAVEQPGREPPAFAPAAPGNAAGRTQSRSARRSGDGGRSPPIPPGSRPPRQSPSPGPPGGRSAPAPSSPRPGSEPEPSRRPVQASPHRAQTARWGGAEGRQVRLQTLADRLRVASRRLAQARQALALQSSVQRLERSRTRQGREEGPPHMLDQRLDLPLVVALTRPAEAILEHVMADEPRKSQ